MVPDLSKRIEELALMLTGHLSVLNTPGEVAVSTAAYDFFAALPYFKQHADLLQYIDVPGDALGRRSVMAVLRGEADADNRRTVVCIGHMDTVGISDYGTLQHLAGQPDALMQELLQMQDRLPEECQADLRSGNYLFGRGIFDMKAGLAVLMALLEHLAADPASFSGNLIVIGVCDEEGSSAGMLSAVSRLRAMQDSRDYDFRALLDTDYMTSEYAGDPNKYVYIGTVGKLMPAFYIVGKETHVGEPFKGLDPNQIAAQLTALLAMNPEYSDVAEGEAAPPPVVLYQRDLKPEYSVQTARTALVYFNYATHCSTPDQVLEKMKQAASCAMEQTIGQLQVHFDRYQTMTGKPLQKLPWQVRVLSFAQLCELVRAQRGAAFDAQLQAMAQKLAADDSFNVQEKAQQLMAFVHGLWSDRDPVIVAGFFPPYYPHVYVRGETDKEQELLAAAGKAVEETECRDPLVWKKFFPYISDLSYATAPQNPQIIATLQDNMPGFGAIYDLPLADMQALDLPVIDIGTFGKDAHKFTERLEKNYSFRVTPELVYRTVRNLLTQQ